MVVSSKLPAALVRVVLIEDNPGDVRLIRELLAESPEANFVIDHADRLGTGLDLLIEKMPDVVVLDLGLPDSNGLDPVVAVHDRAPGLPIIVLTGSHDRMLAVETIRAGANYCLVKDQVYGGAELSRALRYAIERQQLEAEIRRKTEEAAASEARLSTIVEHETNGVIVLDRRGKALFANPAAEKLFARAGLDLAGVPFGLPAVKSEGVEVDLAQDGKPCLIVDLRLAETVWESQPAYIATLNDITERKRLEAALREHAQDLEEKNGELDAFAYSISHDLKEPVRSVTMFSTFLIEDYAERLDEAGVDYLDRIQKAGEQMTRMIDDLLAVARAGRETSPAGRVALAPVLESVLQQLTGAIELKGAVVEVQPGLPDVRGDPASVGQIFQNLVGNGLKFNESYTPLVQVGSTVVEAGMARFFVRDNGIGIAPEYHERVFGLFQRLSERGKYEGTGAGLAIVKRVIERLGGRIWIDSALGDGTTIWFTLPAWDAGSAGQPLKAA